MLDIAGDDDGLDSESEDGNGEERCRLEGGVFEADVGFANFDTSPVFSSVGALSAVVSASSNDSARSYVDSYDSGASSHLCPYRERFVSLTAVQPRPINAANRQAFRATAVGDLIVEVPNSSQTTHLWLQNALFAPVMNRTPVSLGRLDDAGYMFHGGGGQLALMKGDHRVGLVSKKLGTYRVTDRRTITVDHLPKTLSGRVCRSRHRSFPSYTLRNDSI